MKNQTTEKSPERLRWEAHKNKEEEVLTWLRWETQKSWSPEEAHAYHLSENLYVVFFYEDCGTDHNGWKLTKNSIHWLDKTWEGNTGHEYGDMRHAYPKTKKAALEILREILGTKLT